MAEEFAKNMSLHNQVWSPKITSTLVGSEDAREQLLEECEEIWKQMEECQNKLLLQEIETLPDSDPKLSLLMRRVKALTAEFNQWQKRTPEVMTTNPDVLVALGKDQLQRLVHDLDMVLSTVHAKNKKLKQDLLREQKWLEEQQQLIDSLNQTEAEMSSQVLQFSQQRCFEELKTKMLKIKAYKEEILNALGLFLEDHFPLPKNEGTGKKKKRSSEEPDVQFITLHEILENLINKLTDAPHDPYIIINDSFWSPYIELLLRFGIALRHPEDPNRIRLESFHQ